MTKNSITQLLESWLEQAISVEEMDWFVDRRHRIATGMERDLHVGFGLVGRHMGRSDLVLSDIDRAAAALACPGWDVGDLTVDGAARLMLLLDFVRSGRDFVSAFQALCATADVGEAVILYRGLPLYPDPARLHWQVGEGLRTSIPSVFCAIAHRNPFPAKHFDEARWNHMVLKALFLGVPLVPILGFDGRCNGDLALIAARYADERRAAGRTIAPELWRCVGPYATGALFDTLTALASSDDAGDRAAAALALHDSPDPRAPVACAAMARESRLIQTGALSWSTLPFVSAS